MDHDELWNQQVVVPTEIQKKENSDELVGCYNRSSSGGNVGAAGAWMHLALGKTIVQTHF